MELIDQVTADGEKVVREGKSSGREGSAATSVEVFTFAAGGVAPKKIRYTRIDTLLQREDDSDSAELELDLDASETVALCHGTPREGTGAGTT
ncbi:unnamed protein product [Ectocarpus sp. 12 AP-2014]